MTSIDASPSANNNTPSPPIGEKSATGAVVSGPLTTPSGLKITRRTLALPYEDAIEPLVDDLDIHLDVFQVCNLHVDVVGVCRNVDEP